MNILITGGAGFIGSNLSDALLEEGHEVSIVDNFSTGKKENISSKCKIYEYDLRDPAFEKIFLKIKPEVVYHLAAQIDIHFSLANPIEDADQNILASIKLLELCRKNGVKKIIFASSGGAIYGQQQFFPATEDHPEQPISPYGISKLAVDNYLNFYSFHYGLEFVSLRYSNVYGPRQNFKGEAGVIPIFIDKMLAGEKPSIYGSGEQTRDFIYISDVVKYNLLSLNPDVKGIFNIGTGIETKIIQVYEIIKNFIGNDNTFINLPSRDNDVMRSSISSQKAAQLMGHYPSVNVKDGISLTIDWFKKNC